MHMKITLPLYQFYRIDFELVLQADSDTHTQALLLPRPPSQQAAISSSENKMTEQDSQHMR